MKKNKNIVIKIPLEYTKKNRTFTIVFDTDDEETVLQQQNIEDNVSYR